ncbi:hypothetical protein BASA81_006353 [Batrachochytrium salamandrivorans]|nr:hypothetical protein BASA81_006353 [Batrachochytrium salamandrivorans]
MVRDLATTTCPLRTVAANAFLNAAIGVTNMSPTQTNAIKTSLFNGAFDGLNDNIAKNAMSIVFWLTTTSSTNADSLLLEVGPESTQTSIVGSADTNPRLQVKYSLAGLVLEFLGGFSSESILQRGRGLAERGPTSPTCLRRTGRCSTATGNAVDGPDGAERAQPPAAGVLKANNVALKAGDVINAGDAVTFHQASCPTRSATSNPTARWRPSCLSPVAGTVNLCVKETNDAPEVVGGAQTGDSSWPSPTARASPSRAGTATPTSRSLCHLCYKARPTLLQQTLIGRDTIYYQCEDRAGLAAVSTVTMDIRSALLAGCGAEVLADKTNCRAYGREDYPIRVTLKGYDAVLAHNDASRKLYRLDSLPASGQLFHAGAVNLTYNVQLTDGYSYVNTSAALGANDTDAPDTAITAAACPGRTARPWARSWTGWATPSTAARPTRPAGCPLAFSFSLGYDEDGGRARARGVLTLARERGGDRGVRRERPAGLARGAGAALLPVRQRAQQGGVLRRAGQQRLVPGRGPGRGHVPRGVHLDPRQVSISLPTSFENPVVLSRWRISFFTGGDCIYQGCTRKLGGRAYLSDLNRLFDSLQVLTTLVSGNGSLVVSIWDPVTLPGDFNNANQIVESSERFTNALTTTLNFGTLSANQGVDTSLTAALWAGIAAAIFFVLMSCCACLGCIFRGARRAGGLRPGSSATPSTRSTREMARVMCCALFISRVFPCIKLKTEEALPDEEDMMKEALDGEAKRIALRHLPRQNYTATAIDLDGDGVVDVVVLDDPNDEMDSIFNWERHVDASNRVFYYNVKTNVSSWTPPTVKVDQGHVTTAHRQSLSRRNSGLELGLGLEPAPLAVVAATKLTPVPPSAPKPVPAPPPGTKFAPMPPAASKTQKPADLADLAGGEEDRVKGG